MDSSVKYEKFAVVTEGDGEKRPEAKKSSLLVIGFALIIVALLVAVVLAIAIGVGMGVSDSNDSGESTASGLTVSTLTQEELQGEYYGSAGGISFKVTVNDSFAYFSLTTSSGDPVALILNFVQSSIMMVEIDSTGFMMMKNQPGKPKYVDYVIPENYMDTMKSMMMNQEEMTDDVLQHLDNETVNETRQTSLEKLVQSQEVVLLIEAVQALANKGLVGTDYPPAKSFYLIAFQLAKIGHSMEATNPIERDGGMTEKMPQKRATQCSQASGGDVCARCPYSAYNNDCFGLCGKGCSCWSFICNNCCVNTFCETHDYCCYVNGFFTFVCFSVVGDSFRGINCAAEFDC